MLITRRQLLQSSTALVPAFVFLPTVIRRAVVNSVPESGIGVSENNRTLIIVQMAGGNDGLNTVIPYTDSRYYDYRPEVTIPQEQVIPLNDEVGFHPSLTEFKSLWDEGVLAIVEGMGYPEPSYSHFQSMDIWRTADLEGKLKNGWLGRYLETLNRDEWSTFRGMAVGRALPQELSSPKVSIPIVKNVVTYRLKGDPSYPTATQARTEGLLELYAAAPPEKPYATLLDNTMGVAYQSVQALQQADQAYKSAIVYPDTPLGKGLKLIAEAITGNLGITVGHITIGGFDTHADQRAKHSQLLKILAEGIHAFYQDLKAHDRDRDVVVMTWSEFGRRVKSNASNGTDHGSAGPLFFIGTKVVGGFHGQRPDLGNLDKDNLRFTTDFRTVYTTVLEKWLGASAEVVLGDNRFGELPIFSQE
jgi:uncharacterized protein (DUF1501 family)